MGMLRVEITTVCMLGWGLQKDKKNAFRYKPSHQRETANLGLQVHCLLACVGLFYAPLTRQEMSKRRQSQEGRLRLTNENAMLLFNTSRYCGKSGVVQRSATLSKKHSSKTPHSPIPGGVCCVTWYGSNFYPVSSDISDFTPCAHTQSNILHIKYAQKTDDYGLGFGV